VKICVYAISKNEEKNVKDWYNSMSEADGVYVLDTGSSDKTVKLLKKMGAIVQKKKIIPWRFDVARNASLDMIKEDYDLYVCTDLDERFAPGWREILEKNYDKNFTRVKYLYNWSFDQNNNPSTTFYLNKIHNKDYRWKNAVHEVLYPLKEEKEQYIEKIVLNHFQTYKESRNEYLPLLEQSVKDNPLDDRNMHYLGREYMYYERYFDAIKTLHQHLNLKTATWKDERCASMRFIARCYRALGFTEESLLWYDLAVSEAPHLREGYVELAMLEIELKNYENALFLLDKALEIKEKSKSYINENFAWDYQIYNLYSICAYYTNKKDIAKKYNEIAISLDPSNEMLLKNKLFFD